MLIEQDSKNLFGPFICGKWTGRGKCIRNYGSIVRRTWMKHDAAIDVRSINCSVNMWNPRGGKASTIIFEFGDSHSVISAK